MSISYPFDHYTWRARLQPALITLLPIAFAAFAWAGMEEPWLSALWTVAGTGGFTYLLSMVARNRGKQIEPRLWQKWQGCPTTQFLRHSGPANRTMRASWHSRLEELRGRSLPTADEESHDPRSADVEYEASTRFLIARTRDVKKYRLLYNENVFYGFCRNLYAMKAFGIFIAAIGATLCFLAALWRIGQELPSGLQWSLFAGCLFLLWCWIFRINANWVRIPAFAYAERLMESIESIPVENINKR